MFFCRRLLLVVIAIAVGNSTVDLHAHDPGPVQTLDFVGTSAPFGLSNHIYTDVSGVNDYAYLGTSNAGVAVIDLNDPAEPVHRATYNPAGNVAYNDLTVQGEFGYFAGSGGVHIVDISNPRSPRRISRILAADNGFSSVDGVVVSGDALFQISADEADVKVFDISDKASPIWVRDITTSDVDGLGDISILNDRLFVAGLGGVFGGGSTYIYNVANVLSTSPNLLGSLQSGALTSGVASTTDGKYLVTTQSGVGGALTIWNIENVSFPVKVGEATAASYALSAFSAGEVVADGLSVFASWRQAGLQILDLDSIDDDGIASHAGTYQTSPGSSPLDGLTATRSTFLGLGPNRILISDTKSGLHIVDASGVLSTDDAPGDFDRNGTLSIDDLDLLAKELALGGTNSEFDVDGNTVIDDGDIAAWLSIAGTANIGQPYINGDANLDGRVDPSDLNALALNWEQTATGWSAGDFTANGVVDASDLNVLGLNWLSGNAAVAAVPEPSGLYLLLAFGLLLIHRRLRG